MSLSGYAAVIALALLEGALVALPRADALEALGNLRSPAWAALLPGSIVIGTYAPLVTRSAALVLVGLAAIMTPVLATVAVLGVVRGSRAAGVVIGLAVTVAAALISGWAGQLSASVLTALGCLALGTALARLIPRPWVVVGMIGTCLADIALLASGAGHTAGMLIGDAMTSLHGPVFNQAGIGPVSVDYPDLIMAAVLGGFLAGRPQQMLAAGLLTTFGAAYGMLLPAAGFLPATVPIVLTLLLLEGQRLRGRRGAIAIGPAGGTTQLATAD